MADWPILPQGNGSEAGSLVTASTDITYFNVTAGAKVAWQELIASTERDGCQLILRFDSRDDYKREYLVDIGIGSSGNELVLIPDILINNAHGTTDSGFPTAMVSIPLFIPAGSRIVTRAMHNTSVAKDLAVYAMVIYSDGHSQSYQTVDSYGVDDTVSSTAGVGCAGVEVDPGGTANTKGAYSEITASCNQINGFFFCIGNKNNDNRDREASFALVDIAVGAAGSEQNIIENWHLRLDDEIPAPNISPYIPISVPAGSRISARAQCYTNHATNRLFDITLYGVR